jgi:hypothetical protein
MSATEDEGESNDSGGRKNGPRAASVVGLESVPEALFFFLFSFLILFGTLLQKKPYLVQTNL